METAIFNQHSIELLLSVLVILLLLSAFFSGCETSMMALNPYRLRHRAKTSKSARRVLNLFLQRERILSVILIGNNFVNVFASSIATIIGLQYFGDSGILIATITLTIVLLIFGEITPKTLASLKPEKYSAICSWPLLILLKIFYPLAWLTNVLAMTVLKLLGLRKNTTTEEGLTEEELLTLVNASKHLISSQHQVMMSNILNLRNITVDDIMISKHDVTGIDIADDIKTISERLLSPRHTFLPVYDHDLDDLKGFIYSKDIPAILLNTNFNKKTLFEYMQKPYFIPEGASLHTQLVQFKQNRIRIGFIVNEYGDIQGIITIDDIIEEILGELPQVFPSSYPTILVRTDGSFIVDGSINLRKLNRLQNWALPLDTAKTLNGLILEYLDCIPEDATCLNINGHRMEILKIQDNLIQKVKFYPSS